MAKLIGTGTNQVPTNGMLGGMAFQTPEDVTVEKIQENDFNVVTQTDIGTAPNQIPLNQFLGGLAYMDSVAGLDFSATSSSSTATVTSQVLDDYEEGTFQPSIGNGFSSVSYLVRAGRYIKIGRYVHIDFYLRFGTGSAANGQHIYIDDLPYVLSAENYDTPSGQWTRGGGTTSFQNLSIADGVIAFYGASTQNRMTTYYSGGNAWGTNVANANGLYIIGAFNYITD